MMDPLVEKEPLVKTAQAAEFARGRTGVNAVRPEVLKKPANILFRGSQEGSIPAFEEFGKGAQIALVGFAGERAKALLDAQVNLVVLEKSEIVSRAHPSIIGVE
jgi:hypothetical protein